MFTIVRNIDVKNVGGLCSVCMGVERIYARIVEGEDCVSTGDKSQYARIAMGLVSVRMVAVRQDVGIAVDQESVYMVV